MRAAGVAIKITLTHPDIAALVTPLYAKRKEGIFNFLFFSTLFLRRIERVVQRSTDRVSQLYDIMQ